MLNLPFLPRSSQSSRSKTNPFMEETVGNQSTDRAIRELKGKINILMQIFVPHALNPGASRIVKVLREVDALVNLVGEEFSNAGDTTEIIQQMADLNLRVTKMIDQLDEKDKLILRLTQENEQLKRDKPE